MSHWTYRVVNPTTGLVGPDLGNHPAEEVERRVAGAFAAWQGDWRARSHESRGQVLLAAAALLRERKEALAGLMADEMGKVLPDGFAEVDKCALACEHAAEHAPVWLAPEPHPTEAEQSYVRYDPLGVVLAIMPWNFPLWQLFRFGAPALAAGNAFVLKHAPNTPGCGVAIEALLRDAGVPTGLCPNARLDAAQVEALIADPRIAAVTLTGSTEAGRSVAALAGRSLKRTVLELGGSDAFVVLADADVAEAAAVAVRSRTLNGGQSCIAAKRFIVVEEVAEQFRELVRAGLEAVRYGDPHDTFTGIGPLARQDLRDGLHLQVVRSIEAGARCLLGGHVPDLQGWFYPPTLLVDVEPGMPAWDEELFGPVAALRVVPDEARAIEAANESVYGLAATLWTRDRERAERLVPQLEAGAVFVNAMVRSDPRLPFGGIKQSGWGKELGRAGMRELTNQRAVWIG